MLQNYITVVNIYFLNFFFSINEKKKLIIEPHNPALALAIICRLS
ncbi:hypothetical protein C3B55_00632 [Candidatus Pseudomonas adelgestsugas]|uniref:Uncharacterized protein n=1 Tax=Candidatus Pseudomonas adelgestsugas TaxID=1302376 RepID=A0ABX5R9D0_9PSED|nr:hypothetical protein C3B55_00632 [Candidatus Pseudomonas adelgestsugas]